MEIDIPSILKIGEDNNRKPQFFSADETGRRTGSAVIPNGYTEVVIKPGDLAEPLFVAQEVTTYRVADFIAYVNKYREPNSLVTLAPTVQFNGKPIANAILDYHRPAGAEGDLPLVGVSATPEWQRHNVAYIPQISPAYRLLTAVDSGLKTEKLFDQDVFTAQLHNLSRFLVSMERAELLELLRTFKVTTTGAYKSSDDPITGSVDFVYAMQVQGSAGTAEKKVTVPTSFVFEMPILHDGEPIRIEAEFRYRAPSGDGPRKVQMGLCLINREWDELDALEKLGERIAAETQLLTIVGQSHNAYNAI